MICKLERPVRELLWGKLSGLQKFYQNLTRLWVLKLLVCSVLMLIKWSLMPAFSN